MERDDAADAEVLEVDLGPGVLAFFTTRHGGLSGDPWSSLNLGLNVGDDPATVGRNRERIDALVGAPVSYTTQVHGADVLVVREAPERSVSALGEFDASVTRARGVPLGVLVADCVPVLLADAGAGVVAVAHAGRAGVALGVVDAAVSRMVDEGARTADVVAVVGPSVCGRCYEVPQDLADAVAAAVPAARSRTTAGTPGLDLPRAVLSQARAAGVGVVHHIDRCTLTDHTFFSHRRATAAGDPAGRFAGVVMLTG